MKLTDYGPYTKIIIDETPTISWVKGHLTTQQINDRYAQWILAYHINNGIKIKYTKYLAP